MDGFWQWWGTLSQGLRDTIVGGLVLILVGGILTVFRKAIAAGWKRLRPKEVSNIEPTEIKQIKPPEPPIEAPHLPRPPEVGFVARRDKDGHDIVTLLKAELAPERNQLIVLWGEGGIGKTTLAVEAARELFAVFGNRILWKSADGLDDFTLSTLLDEIAKQLGNEDLRRLALEPKKEDVRKLLAAAPSLIVLDNYETISAVEQVNCANWIADAPCPALITTRQQLNGRRNIWIDAMSSEEAREFLDRLIALAGGKPAFKKLDRDRIIQAAASNPLVMQWIIAQIVLAQRPNDVLDDLAHGEGDAAQRVFNRSFNLSQLSDDGRAALLALSLFAPSASRAALSEVAGLGSDVKRLNEAIKSLAALCLVEPTDEGERLSIKGLTRELARAHLRKDQRANEFRLRFVSYFLRYAEAHAETAPEDFDALESEKDNLLNAMDAAFEIEDWESVIRMMDAIGIPPNGFLSLRGYWDEFIRRGEQALKAARILQRQADIARVTHNIAVMYQNRGDLSEARRLYNESLEINKRLSYQSGIASTLHQLAILAQDQGDLDEARRLYGESLEIKKKLGDQSGIASTSHQLGRLAQEQGGLDEARRLYNESLEISKRLGDQSGIAITLHQLGRLAEEEGDKTEAARLFREAVSIFEKLGSPNAEIARRSLKRVEGEADE